MDTILTIITIGIVALFIWMAIHFFTKRKIVVTPKTLSTLKRIKKKDETYEDVIRRLIRGN